MCCLLWHQTKDSTWHVPGIWYPVSVSVVSAIDMDIYVVISADLKPTKRRQADYFNLY